MGVGAHALKRIPRIKFPHRHPKPSGFTSQHSQHQATSASKDAPQTFFSGSTSKMSVGGKASAQPKRTSVSQEEIDSIMVREPASPRFGQEVDEKNALTWHYSLPSSTNGKMIGTPYAPSKWEIWNQNFFRSLSSSRDGSGKILYFSNNDSLCTKTCIVKYQFRQTSNYEVYFSFTAGCAFILPLSL